MMNNWFKFQLHQLLWNTTTIKDSEIVRILESLSDTLENKKLAVLPLYLSDEMFASILERCPCLSYEEANKVYTSAVKGHLN